MNTSASPSCGPTVAAIRTPFLRYCVNAVRGRLFGGSTGGEGGERHIDWSARLAASLKPNQQYLSRRAAAKRGHITRRNRQARK